MHGMTATSCAFGDPQVVKDFAECGVDVMMIWIEIAIKCWKGQGEYDWSYAEEKLEHFEKYAPDQMWILRIRLSLVASWFKDKFPTEIHNEPGRREFFAANIHSSIWVTEVGKLLTAFVKWVETTRWAPKIIGFMINAGATEEWLVFNTDELYKGQYPEPITRRANSRSGFETNTTIMKQNCRRHGPVLMWVQMCLGRG
jgi:hypothetical protein